MRWDHRRVFFIGKIIDNCLKILLNDVAGGCWMVAARLRPGGGKSGLHVSSSFSSLETEW